MNKQNIATIVILLLISHLGLAASTGDTIVSGRSMFVIPFGSYQQETSFSAGIAYGYYFKSNDISKISSISGSVSYTFRNQFIFNIAPKIYIPHRKLFLYSNLSLRKYPDYFYGISNKPTATKLAYTSQNMALLMQPQYMLSKHFYVGVSISGRLEQPLYSIDSAIRDSLFKYYGNAGWNSFTNVGVGVIAAYDSRNNQFYPERGSFVKILLSASEAGWGSTYSLRELNIDCRHYFPLFNSHVWAWQAYYASIEGKKGIPFQLLPTLGGRDAMRGFRQGMYRENVVFLLQTEYRFPIYKRLKAAVFCSAGDVVNSSNYVVEKLKVAYGAGLRYRLNDARVHLRLDVAKNNYGDKLQLYITATEAF